MDKARPIILPKEIQQPSAARSLLSMAATWVMFYGAIAVVAALFASSWPLWIVAPLVLLTCVVGGYGVLDMGFVGHDGFHFSLHSNKRTSALLAIAGNLPIFFPITGFAVSHWNHHRFTNGAEDPDVQIFGRFQSFPTRILFARPFAILVYLRNALCLATGRELPYAYSFPIPRPEMQRYAQLNLLGAFAWLTLTAAVLVKFPFLVLPFALVLGAGSMISGLSPYVEHTETGQGRGHDTRTTPSFLRDYLLMNNNYHIEHHLYPTVPAHNLKRAYLFLRQAGFYDEKRFVTQGYWQAFVTTFTSHRYPNFGAKKPR